MPGTIRSSRAALASALLFCAPGAASADFSISRFTVDGGGARSTGGAFAVAGTIGQPDAGRLSGSGFTLHGGFWFGGGGEGTATAVPGETPGVGPAGFRVYPAHPNPVTRRTVIAFDLPVPGPVRAALFDASGRLVRVLADEPLPAGKHERAWDRLDDAGRPAPAGIYFLRLEAGAQRSRQKIVVVS